MYYKFMLNNYNFLVPVFPDYADAQVGLASSYDKIGDLGIAKARLRSSISAVESSDGILSVLSPFSLDEALASYRQALEIGERLAAADRNSTLRQQNLSIAYEKIGDVLAALGNRSEAVASYRKALAIAERLVAADSSNVQWQISLALQLIKLCVVSDPTDAKATLRKALAILEPLGREHRLSAEDQSILIEGQRVWSTYFEKR
jgi:tetratricopeptide (TPR) repeat protein